MSDIYSQAAEKVANIEAALKDAGLWWEEEPEYDPATMGAFGMNVMAFGQWLQFVFLSRVKDIIESRDEFPSSSMIAVQAFREFDGDESKEQLIDILTDFDHFIISIANG